MRLFKYITIGVILLFLLSFTNLRQAALEGYVEGMNTHYPKVVSEMTTVDSIKCQKESKMVVMYCTSNDAQIEYLRNLGEEMTKKTIVTNFQSYPSSQEFLDLMASVKFSYRVEYRTKEGELAYKITIMPEDFNIKDDDKGTEEETLNRKIKALKETCPMKIDETLSLTDVAIDWTSQRITYTYELHDVEIEDKDAFIAEMEQGVAGSKEIEGYKSLKLTTILRYINGEEAMDIVIKPDKTKKRDTKNKKSER